MYVYCQYRDRTAYKLANHTITTFASYFDNPVHVCNLYNDYLFTQ